MSKPSGQNLIRLRGVRHNNLKNFDLDLPLNQLIVITGLSGSGKSSLAFDTLYAEGQRRYIETFSPYARQFFDRMDKPQVNRIDGIPPAIAIDQTNPVRTSRSTVGTMTELADYLKLLYARAAMLYCRGCGRKVTRDTPETIYDALAERSLSAGDPRLVVTFPVTVPDNFSEAEIVQLLERQGYSRIHARSTCLLELVQDRFRMVNTERARVSEAREDSLRARHGLVDVHAVPDESSPTTAPIEAGARANIWRFSTDLHCPE